MERASEKVSVQAGTPVKYERPRIAVLGTVAELTRGETGPGNDAQNVSSRSALAGYQNPGEGRRRLSTSTMLTRPR
jgi:hypothetical protein